ncbi:hypothetical protein HDU67_007568 [Dinochytrium kinnereticum]|nr:hypothetical protein HDU67_007568 [Dinochytrium kinnereticum]
MPGSKTKGAGSKPFVQSRLKKRIIESLWLSCPCCGYSRSKRKSRTARIKSWTCESLLDQIEGRLFCSRLCGDSIAQIECDMEGCDHGCAACFKDGNVVRTEDGNPEGIVKGWICKENESDSDLGDDDEEEEDDDEDLAALGLDGNLVVGLTGTAKKRAKRQPTGDDSAWWEKKAKRCRELGSMFGECVCGECDIYDGALDGELLDPN